MIDAKHVKDFLKVRITCPDWSIGRINENKSKTCAIITGLKPISQSAPMKGVGFSQVSVRAYLRFGNNFDEGTQKANEIHQAMCNASITVGEHKAWLYTENSSPIFIGSDDKGIFEFAVDGKLIQDNRD